MVEVEEKKGLNLELSDSALMIIGALRGNNAKDILQMLPRKDVEVILNNREEISNALHKIELKEVENQGEVEIAKAKNRMKASIFNAFGS